MQSIGTAALLLGALTVFYVVRAAWWPFVQCRRCQGAGERRPRFSLRAARCSRCAGSGERLRLGIRVLHASRGYGR